MSSTTKDVEVILQAIRTNGFKVVLDGKGSAAVKRADGKPAVDKITGAPVTIHLTPSDSRWRESLLTNLERAGVISRDDVKRPEPAGVQRARAARAELRQEFQPLRERLAGIWWELERGKKTPLAQALYVFAARRELTLFKLGGSRYHRWNSGLTMILGYIGRNTCPQTRTRLELIRDFLDHVDAHPQGRAAAIAELAAEAPELPPVAKRDPEAVHLLMRRLARIVDAVGLSRAKFGQGFYHFSTKTTGREPFPIYTNGTPWNNASASIHRWMQGKNTPRSEVAGALESYLDWLEQHPDGPRAALVKLLENPSICLPQSAQPSKELVAQVEEIYDSETAVEAKQEFVKIGPLYGDYKPQIDTALLHQVIWLQGYLAGAGHNGKAEITVDRLVDAISEAVIA